MKSAFKSKTIWLNVAMGVIAVATFIDPELLTALGFNEANQHNVLTIVGALTAILNVMLRMATSEPVSFKKGKKESL